VKLEFCSEGFRHVPQAIELGIDRVELCLDLRVHGLTPPLEVVKKTVEYCHAHDVEVATMVRPLAEGFVYDLDYGPKLLEEVRAMMETNSDALVLGCLTEDFELDRALLEQVAELVDGRNDLVFHDAFNLIVLKQRRKIESAVDSLVELGFQRILTHAGNPRFSALENAGNFRRIIQAADGRIEVMAGGGVTWENVRELDRAIHADAYHGTKIVNLGKFSAGNGEK
jgi:copper homeostasis protein